MTKKSAGIVLFRRNAGKTEFLLVHPGGPFWAKKDAGAWSVPKGEFMDNEEPLEAAIREFREETGMSVSGHFITLTPVRQTSGKTVHAFALELDFDIQALKSNTFSMEWPPKSGKQQAFPEIDKAGWFDAETSKVKLVAGQVPVIEELVLLLK